MNTACPFFFFFFLRESETQELCDTKQSYPRLLQTATCLALDFHRMQQQSSMTKSAWQKRLYYINKEYLRAIVYKDLHSVVSENHGISSRRGGIILKRH